MDKNSNQYKNELKEKLIDIANNIDDVYYTLEKELHTEITKKQEKKEIMTKGANDLFDKLNYTICDKILKKKLPLRVRLFNNIKCMGYAVTQRNQIEIEFAFNDRFGTRFCIELGLQEIYKYVK